MRKLTGDLFWAQPELVPTYNSPYRYARAGNMWASPPYIWRLNDQCSNVSWGWHNFFLPNPVYPIPREGQRLRAQGWGKEQSGERIWQRTSQRSEIRGQQFAIHSLPVFNLSISFRLALRFTLSFLLHAPCSALPAPCSLPLTAHL